MTKFSLTAQNGEGNASHPPLPTLTIQTFFDELTAQLAVIFDVKNSPTPQFGANFPTYDALTLSRVLQEDFLWKNHCYELFLAFDNQQNSPYVEINFAPTGAFNLYHFDRYRTPPQMPPRRLQVTASERQHLMNCYNVRQDWHAVFWQDSLSPQRGLRDLVEENFPLEADSHRLVMMVNVNILAKLLKVKKTNKVWLNPCAVFKGEQAMAYFAYQHANPPDFHDKDFWLNIEIS